MGVWTTSLEAVFRPEPDLMNAQFCIEICAGDLESALEAGRGGADRVELCDNLLVGGTTPSAGTIAEACRRLAIPVHVLIRPRAGDFLATEAELAAMRHDIATARRLGAAGVVLGILGPDGTVDRDRTASLADHARPLRVTFHKAFDQTRDPDEALDVLSEIGIDRVLSSGCRPSALEGIDVLRRMVERARGRIAIMAGGRLNAENLGTVLARTRVREVHLGSAVSQVVETAMTRAPSHSSEPPWNKVDAARVRSIVDLVATIDSDGRATT
jgi:copper homeostasis protein